MPLDGIKMKFRIAYSVLIIVLIILNVMFTGCISSENPRTLHVSGTSDVNYSLTEDGILEIEEVGYSYSPGNVTNSGEKSSIKISELWVDDGKTDVYAILAEPPNPKAGIVFAPGAGVSADSHLKRAVKYGESGIAFMIVDIRGNGGKTPGFPLDLQNEFETAASGKTPQYYSIIFDLIAAKNYLKEICGYDLPVYVMGSSNGGRYASVAAGADSEFAGFFGVSTSGYEYEEGVNGQDVDLFIKSINPDTYVPRISPAKTVIFHASEDDIVGYEYGLDLFNKASEPKDFVAFNGTHGINDEVDMYVMNLLAGN